MQLAYKAKEIEELADVYFFRPAGMIFARAAQRIGLTPTGVTIVSMAFGIAGGVFLYWPAWRALGFALIIFYSVLDSSDGQLARMTGRSSDLGRLLDGIGGAVTYVAVYAAIVAAAVREGADAGIVAIAGGAAVAMTVHAMMYDYHRTSYIRAAIDGEPRRAIDVTGVDPSGLLRLYETIEARLSGRHPAVEAAMASRAIGGTARAEDRARYRRCFYWPVRGWNLMGDNTRFYGLGASLWLGRPEWFFVFLLLPMTIALVALWLWQARADRRFLEGL